MQPQPFSDYTGIPISRLFCFICQRINSSINLIPMECCVSFTLWRQSRSQDWCSAFSVHREDNQLCFWAKWTSGSKCSGREIMWTTVCGYQPPMWLLLLQNWYKRLLKALQVFSFFFKLALVLFSQMVFDV